MKRSEMRTDLALEVQESFQEDRIEISGVSLKEETGKRKGIRVTTVEIMNEEGARAMGKPQGTYITIEIPELLKEEKRCVAVTEKEIETQLRKLLEGKRSQSILIVGLGNREITADALGPMVIDRLCITRHLFKEYGENFGEEHGCRMISALAPGVMAQTGMETVEIIKGIVAEINPDLILAIDALAAKSVHRLNTTIQLTDTGICPGAGIGNNRQALNEESLGRPVLALGVPTVVDAGTIVREGMEQLFHNRMAETEETDSIFDFDVTDFVKHMFVTPKQIDCSMRSVSTAVANGINRFISVEGDSRLNRWLGK